MSAAAEEPTPPTASEPNESDALMHKLVRVGGLTSPTGQALNGRLGTVADMHSLSGRLSVCLGKDQTYNIKAVNLINVEKDLRKAAYSNLRSEVGLTKAGDMPLQADRLCCVTTERSTRIPVFLEAPPFFNGPNERCLAGVQI